MRRRQIIRILLLVALGAGPAAFLLTYDGGQPVVVQGNFTAKDITQIKSAVRRQLWREVFPAFSTKTVMKLPLMAKRAMATRAEYIQMERGTSSSNRCTVAVAWWEENGKGTGYLLTNVPKGWTWAGTVYMSPMPRL
jgi:hypothetical protein